MQNCRGIQTYLGGSNKMGGGRSLIFFRRKKWGRGVVDFFDMKKGVFDLVDVKDPRLPPFRGRWDTGIIMNGL